MSNQNKDLITILKETLSKDKRFVTDNGELIKASITSASMQLEADFIRLLLSSEIIKREFFTEIDNIFVFDKVKFNWVINNKQFLPDSYTKYKNKIGLSTNDYNLITENNDVSLVFPYKDSILEGGQTSENEQKDEVFYNEILASEEIRNLLSPKAITNAKKYTAVGVEEVTNIDKEDNLIIKGNNLLALSSLLENYRNKIKLIYIDPPYNTDSDSFHYNDKFNHSTWLTFMKNRLEIAKELLADDGTIFIQCDDNEQAYLKVLMDEIFGRNNFVNNIAVKMSEASGVKMNHANKRFPKIKEYILFYKMDNFKEFYEIDKYKIDKWDKENNIFLENLTREDRKKLQEIEDKEINSIDDVNISNEILSNVIKRPLSSVLEEQNFSSYEEENDWLFNNSYRIIKTAGSSSLAKIVKNSLDDIPNQDIAANLSKRGLLFFYITDFNQDTKQPRLQVIFADSNLYKNPCDFWEDIKTTGAISNEGGVQLNNGKKPEKLLQRIIKMTTREGDFVLDFFLGSGTTAAVAHKMNRKYIGIEQMDYIEDLAVKRLENVISGDKTGVSKDYNWQGGGSFIYLELKELNEKFIEEIDKTTTTQNLKSIYKKLKEKGLLVPSLETNALENEKDFNDLTLEQQKEVIILAIDKNKLYVNANQVDDEEINLSEYEKTLTMNFYGKDNPNGTTQGTLSI